ncbi:cysteine desulfurase/selenocysteine lyase [Cenarchaeum symbiosum A]|uniref:Cysteine desulfurase/selenocysteine lyase n=1 Tax=Cenarchaeum symbiosum (strain A) TaxID=414004 RepID=A0RUA9_CENSY|nr:cysteine desulfurase/selenocysteine lyase [Cenarchaeum symbiosum A]
MGADQGGDFPRGKICMNNASVSPNPAGMVRAVARFLEEYSVMGPDTEASDEFVTSMLGRTRDAVSRLIGCRPAEIVLTQSTTDGINAVSRGLSMPRGSSVIIRGGAHEHHANYYPWLRTGAEVRSIPIDKHGSFDTSLLRGMIDGGTRVAALSHALYNTGAVMPAEETGEILESAGVPYFVDAAQTVGCMKVDVSRLRCSFMSFNGSKWLCGPMGTGLFYCREDAADTLEPISTGGESADLGDSGLEYKKMPERFQTGFRNYAGMAGLEYSLGIISDVGVGAIQERAARLSRRLRDGIGRIPGSMLYGPEEGRTSIVPFNLQGVDPADAVKRLEEQGIVLALREITDLKIIRASPHFFNTGEEVDRVLEALAGL